MRVPLMLANIVLVSVCASQMMYFSSACLTNTHALMAFALD